VLNAAAMPTISVVDDLGRELRLPGVPERIVSLVPSETYNLLRLGAGSRIVGRTRYCTEPAGEVDAIPIVGGTKDVDVDAVVAARPQVVIANREENTKHAVLTLEAKGLKVFVAFPKTVAAGAGHVARLARLLGTVSDETRAVVASAYDALREAEAHAATVDEPLRAFVPIWMDPLMTANGDTFLSDVLRLCGATNVFVARARRYPLAADMGRAAALEATEIGDRDTRYPRVTLDEVRALAPEVVLLPDEPYAFGAKEVAFFGDLDVPAAKSGRIHLCAGKDLMWPGLRTLEGLATLRPMLGRTLGRMLTRST
jgi:ABC-type Fe3+-hydroxamate transport system substrate-binding protein